MQLQFIKVSLNYHFTQQYLKAQHDPAAPRTNKKIIKAFCNNLEHYATYIKISTVTYRKYKLQHFVTYKKRIELCVTHTKMELVFDLTTFQTSASQDQKALTFDIYYPISYKPFSKSSLIQNGLTDKTQQILSTDGVWSVSGCLRYILNQN